MNRQHFLAFLWLRWRLLVNQLRRGGFANAVILGLLAVAAVVVSASLFVGILVVGLVTLPDVSALTLLYVWDGLVVAFLFSWMVGLLHELQRSEVLSLDKFLHLPVSLTSVFLINYLSSLFSVSMVLFLPAMLALSLALVFAKGPAMLLLLPLLAAFLLMVTALTYQFQGWLAALMANPRRRRTIIVLVTAAFIVLCQLPNLVNIARPWERTRQSELTAETRAQENQLQHDFSAGVIGPAEYHKRAAEIRRAHQEQVAELDRQALRRVEATARIVNLVLPPGWLPLGAMYLAEGEIPLALPGILGLTSIGAFSLWRSYRTTLRLYTGHYSAGARAPVAAAAPAAAVADNPPANLLEKRLPWLSEQAAVVALGGFRSLLRAPEAKMMLLTPFIMVVVFGSLFLARSGAVPQGARPLLAYGALAMVLMNLTQFVGNPFGFDRGGFRLFVLSAAPRREILLGKNLACVPLALALDAVMLALLQILYPVPVDYFAGALIQSLTMYLLFCALANWIAIFGPMPMRSGSLKPVNPRGLPLLLQFAFMFLFPLALLPALIPLGAALALENLGWVKGVPVCSLLAAVECVLVALLYRLVLGWQGDVLQARELSILNVVTAKAE